MLSLGPSYPLALQISLDDFLIWAPDLASCSHMLRLAIQTAARLGLPLEPSKVEGPSSYPHLSGDRDRFRQKGTQAPAGEAAQATTTSERLGGQESRYQA